MKSILRSYMRWSQIDKQLEEVAKSCVACQIVKSKPATPPLHPHPMHPWQRLHVDFAGLFKGKMLFLIAK